MHLLILSDQPPNIPIPEILSDQPPNIPIPEILSGHPEIELIVSLGDFFEPECLAPLTDITHIPKIGIYGNHCNGEYMESIGMHNIHLRPAVYKGVRFIWYQGCVRYVENCTLMSTQSECNDSLEKMPECDVFVTHCPPRGINDAEDIGHIGFDGIRKYLDLHAPKYLLHGHTYDDGLFVEKYKNTRIIYVNGWKIIEIHTDSS